jgi:hypothetical protein
MDWKVSKFITKYHYDKSDKELSLDDKIKIIKKTILD